MQNKIPASQYCESVFDGTHDTPKPVTAGYPLVTSKNILGGKLNLSDAYHISKENYAAIQKRSAVSQWDVLFSMIGSVGEVYLEKSDSIPYAIKNIGVFSCKNEHRAKWLYYYLLSPWARKYISNYLNGAVQKFLPLGALRDFPVVPYETGKKFLVDLLQTIDSKIEINNRINSELESLAKTIYDYWFVQFDFPDAKDKPYRSSGGEMILNAGIKTKIPKGWEVCPLGKILHTSLGGTPSTLENSYWQTGTINWLSSGEMNNFPITKAEVKITEAAINNSATSLMPKGTVVISITRYIRPTILAIDACANQSVVGIYESKDLKNSYIYPYLKNEVRRYMVIRTGANQPHINKQTIDSSLILKPDNKVLQQYYKICDPIYQKIINNAFQSDELVALRDWLLPMLMNGQVVSKQDLKTVKVS